MHTNAPAHSAVSAVTSGHAIVVAGLLADLVAKHGEIVPRARLRAAWRRLYPEDAAPVRTTPTRRAGLRRRFGDDDAPSSTNGNRAKLAVQDGLKKLEAVGVLVRSDTVVRVLDARAVARIAELPLPAGY